MTGQHVHRPEDDDVAGTRSRCISCGRVIARIEEAPNRRAHWKPVGPPARSFSPWRARRETVVEPEAADAPTFEPKALVVTLSKGEAASMTPDSMRSFLADVAAWAERMAMDGYTIRADPDEGPGTMRWRAER